MNIHGERIIIFGDSLSHHGSDAAPEIWNVDQSSARLSGQPGDLLASMLAEQGAAAVRVNARVSRSAHNFFTREAYQTLLASDQAFAPTKVIIVLGTNDIGQIDSDAMRRIRDFYVDLGAEVWGIGPFAYVSEALNQQAIPVVDMMREVFGARFIDPRPITATVGRARDGVHFGAESARQTALGLQQLVLAASAGSSKPWIMLGLGLVAAVGGSILYSWLSPSKESPALLSDLNSSRNPFIKVSQQKRGKRLAMLIAAFKKSPAVIVTDRSGREELIIRSGEMQPDADGKLRATTFAKDGPRGHISRNSDDELARELATDVAKVRPATDADVIAWTSTPEFIDGSKRVAFMQAVNTLNYKAGQKGKRDQAREVENRAHALIGADIDGAIAILEQGIKDLGAPRIKRPKVPRVVNVTCASPADYRWLRQHGRGATLTEAGFAVTDEAAWAESLRLANGKELTS